MFVYIVGSQLFNSRFFGSQLLHVQLKYVGKPKYQKRNSYNIPKFFWTQTKIFDFLTKKMI